MKNLRYLLFRLNFVDRPGLFEKRIAGDSDDDLCQVFKSAATDQFDYDKRGPRTSYKWALREFIYDTNEQVKRPFICITLSCGITSRRGPIVTPSGIAQGTSTLSPPSATLVHLLIDLKRHICAIEDVPSVMQTQAGWRASLQSIVNSAAWKHGFTSMIRLDPIPPQEAVAIILKSWDRITRLRVTLRIPNPDLGPSYQRLYDEMKRSGVRELSEDMRNESGLTVSTDTLPQASIDMALKGYRKGKLRLNGYRDGHKDEFIMDDEVVHVEVEDIQAFIEGYAAGRRSSALNTFANAIIEGIDRAVNQQGQSHD